MFGLSDAIVKIGAAVLAVLLILVAVYFKGRHDVQVKFDQYKADIKAVAAEQERHTKQIETKTQRLLEETKNAYNTKLNALRAYYSLRITGKSGSGLSQIPITTGGTDGYSPDNLPPTSILASQCAETTLKLVLLQNYERNKALIAE